jgi:hypothetical protein
VEADVTVSRHRLRSHEALSRWALPLAVAAAAVAVSAPGALSHAMWGDEVASARVVTQPDLGGA